LILDEEPSRIKQSFSKFDTVGELMGALDGRNDIGYTGKKARFGQEEGASSTSEGREQAMSLSKEEIGSIPEETVRVARASFPKGNRYRRLRDVLGTIFDDSEFADLFGRRGKPAEIPWRLGVVCLVQYMENLTDREAADAVRAQMDLKYLLGLELTDPGFDFSVLSEFRQRLIEHDAEHRLFTLLVAKLSEQGYLKKRGIQRTDSTHVLAAVHQFHRVELLGETLRAALNELATQDPEWLKQWVPADWFERYSRRVEVWRLGIAKMRKMRLWSKSGVMALNCSPCSISRRLLLSSLSYLKYNGCDRCGCSNFSGRKGLCACATKMLFPPRI